MTSKRKTPILLTALLAAALLLVACGSSSYSGGGTATHAASKSAAPSGGAETVNTAFVSSLHAKTLVDAGGMTLYHLSAEGNGKFICTNSSCLALWHPLTVPAGTQPSGSVSSLGTVKRPDGSMQVTFEGEPLYTFAHDTKPGQASGQGFKDVGTWMAATTSGSASPAPAQPEESESSGTGGYHY
jgi:predicted lipoprotein with Yx(FWY)xxD motif